MSIRAIKLRGFNIKDTRLTDMDRVNKLFALVLVAFIWAYKTGVHLNEEIPIKIKKQDEKLKSCSNNVLNASQIHTLPMI